MEEHRNVYITFAVIAVMVLTLIGIFAWTDAFVWLKGLTVEGGRVVFPSQAPRLSPSPLVFPTATPLPSPSVSPAASPTASPSAAPTPQPVRVRLFFGNQTLTDLSCTQLTGVNRTVSPTPAIARATLEGLLKGPTAAEQVAGLFTSIPEGVKLQSLTIENGIATADFDETLDKGVGGSCRVAAIRAQITQTLRQFPTIQSVVISIDGRTEDILQP